MSLVSSDGILPGQITKMGNYTNKILRLRFFVFPNKYVKTIKI